MLEFTSGNLLLAEADALVNTVNCVGVMGKGIALQFKQAFPANTREYEQVCRKGELHPGKMLVVSTGSVVSPRFIINFPTKTHWKGKSRIAYIEAGLAALVAEIDRLKIHSVAVPPLGCGNGGLLWDDVLPLIQQAFADLPKVRVLVFAPTGAPTPQSMPVVKSEVRMTRVRAILVKLIERYARAAIRLTLLEIQKLAYFVEANNGALNLRFVKHEFGPYSEVLNHALQRLEGQLIRGYGDRSRMAEIGVLPGASERADEFLRGDEEALEILDRVSAIIDGFETPYGLELLATVHWVAKNECPLAIEEEVAIKKVHEWNARKRKIFSSQHIRIAWQHLQHFQDEEAPRACR